MQFSGKAQQDERSILGKLKIRESSGAHAHPLAASLLFRGQFFFRASEHLFGREQLASLSSINGKFVQAEAWDACLRAQEQYRAAIRRRLRLAGTSEHE